jgi:hypothetical protein
MCCTKITRRTGVRNFVGAVRKIKINALLQYVARTACDLTGDDAWFRTVVLQLRNSGGAGPLARSFRTRIDAARHPTLSLDARDAGPRRPVAIRGSLVFPKMRGAPVEADLFAATAPSRPAPESNPAPDTWVPEPETF